MLEKEYDFTGVPERDSVQAMKWYKAERPSSSRTFSPHMRSFLTVWLTWNLTGTVGIPTNYKGYQVRKREESEGEGEDGEAGAAM